ncbi:hypothetical protein DM01DRAFT_1325845 [Hesseltinella vesiculosa]|uniref:Uncharacterized protein n=1 Tax=Hesseltinella vesiculosa TaxID=101127 RepID=A0A1X2GAG1_9FUNG|nr:hypothetical protein DM01DRAFT_1325845 [Hesseltinella vesiculosa]
MMDANESSTCLQQLTSQSRLFQPQAEDILTDEDLLDLFRIVKQVIRKKPDADKLAKLLFCVSYALGDHVKFYKPLHDDRIIFKDDFSGNNNAVRLPSTSSCCVMSLENPALPQKDALMVSSPSTVSSVHSNTTNNGHPSPMTRLLNVPLVSCTAPATPPTQLSTQPLSHPPSMPPHPLLANTPPPIAPTHPATLHQPSADMMVSTDSSADPFAVRPYTNFRPLYPSIPTHPTSFERNDANHLQRYPTPDHASPTTTASTVSPRLNQQDPPRATTLPQTEILMEPKQRGFYYQDGRISREPVLLQRYAEQGILTQASLMRKRKRQSTDANVLFDTNQPPATTKKPKIPHRHGEFEQRRDDILNRLRTLTFQDLEQKAQRVDFALVIEQSPIMHDMPMDLPKEEAAKYLEPSLRILTSHSNMKPHLDNGMNQNGIYYNSDYYRLFMAFEQFQKTFARLFPNEVIKIPEDDLNGDLAINPAANDRDKDRERNANMKAYRGWIEPLLTETNWAAFRRNIVVGERIMQLTKVVGQGVLLMTKELSGSKLHLTFTNNEWDEFITGLSSGRWDATINWDQVPDAPPPDGKKSRLVLELRQKYFSAYWFNPNGSMVQPKERKLLYRTHHANVPSTCTTPTLPNHHLLPNVPMPKINVPIDNIHLLGDMMR